MLLSIAQSYSNRDHPTAFDTAPFIEETNKSFGGKLITVGFFFTWTRETFYLTGIDPCFCMGLPFLLVMFYIATVSKELQSI